MSKTAARRSQNTKTEINVVAHYADNGDAKEMFERIAYEQVRKIIGSEK